MNDLSSFSSRASPRPASKSGESPTASEPSAASSSSSRAGLGAPVSPSLGGVPGADAGRGPDVESPPLSVPAEPGSDGAVFLAIEWDRETTLPAYFSVAAPDELRARELAASITARRGRVLVDVVTPAFLREQLDRAHAHPADHHWSGGAAESR